MEREKLRASPEGAREATRPEFAWLIEKNADGIVVVDQTGTMLFANPAAEEILGRPAAALIGSHIGIPLVAGDTTEIKLLQPGGGTVDAEMRVVEIAWRGRPALMASLRDITSRKALEAQLRQAQKMEALGQLTAGIAHDFNNLLAAIVGGLDIIRARVGDDRLRRLANNAFEAAERGSRLTAQLLAFSRTQRLDLRAVDVNALVVGMGELLARSTGPSVAIRTELDPHVGSALTDANQLELAILNLAINARDAMPDGGAIAISTAITREAGGEALQPGDYVAISVRDTGAGMTPDVLARAFEPFFTTKPVGRGTGLGLSQTYAMSRHCGGTVRIESAVGRGTEVRILLPRASCSNAARDAGVGSADSTAAGPGGGNEILVVDDDAGVRSLIADFLTSLGYAVSEAENGAAGLASIDANAPNLLIVDYAMPGMNGAEVARAARRICPELPVVFVSGYADSAALEASVDGATLLRKPFRMAELASLVSETLRAAHLP